ncbi:MAG TPA: RNA 2',3'-cyclic phosphodiesterase [Burkholderiales bacterium]|nr:RNA 2',3'-cyclic phosphodiesterase [Burkholderiales bacterium]
MKLFFAIWPDESVKLRLDELGKRLHRACGGKITRTESIHLTLVFLGELENSEKLKKAASSVSGKAFEMTVNKVAYWKHNRIAWAGMEPVPEGLGALMDSLRGALKHEGYGFDERRYVPHVTLLRHARAPEILPESESFIWPVSEFCLVGSSDSGYKILERWRLKEDAPLEVSC